MGSNGGETLTMKPFYVIITARTPGTGKWPDKLEDYGGIFDNSVACSLVSGVINKICDRMGINVLKTECFEKDRRMALIMRADASSMKGNLNILRDLFDEAGKKMDAVIKVQKEDLFRYMHRI